jgi:tRNA(fMet)-specific endonuclease VapC
VGELEAGFAQGSKSLENHRLLESFLNEIFVEVVEVTKSTARRYGGLVAQLKKLGKPIPTNDIWIAATTLDRAAHLLTFDRHFEAVPSLETTILSPP